MNSYKYSFLSILFALFFFNVSHGQDFDNVEIEVEKLAENIYMLTGAGGNIGLSVGEDGVVMIDDQYALLTDKIKAAIATVTDQPLSYLINTHWHFDHVGGNENFAKEGALIFAQENVRKRMSADQEIAAFGRQVPASPDAALPVITFSKDLSMHLNGDKILLMHTHNAHTDGDAFVFFLNSNVIHMGDTYFNGLYPFIDVSNGGNIDGMIRFVNNVLFMINDDTRIIPGHGPSSNKKELVEYRDMLQSIRNGVKKAYDAGIPLDEVNVDEITGTFNEKWAKGFLTPENFVKIVYSSFEKD